MITEKSIVIGDKNKAKGKNIQIKGSSNEAKGERIGIRG